MLHALLERLECGFVQVQRRCLLGLDHIEGNHIAVDGELRAIDAHGLRLKHVLKLVWLQGASTAVRIGKPIVTSLLLGVGLDREPALRLIEIEIVVRNNFARPIVCETDLISLAD